MPSNSWQAYLCAMNETDTAKKNFNTFIDAMAIENSKIEKINAITEDPDSIVVVANNHRWVNFVHSCKKFGGTCTISTVSIGGLIGSGPRASLIVINMDVATTAMEVKILPTKKFGIATTPKSSTSSQSTGGRNPTNPQVDRLRWLTRTGRPNVSANKTE